MLKKELSRKKRHGSIRKKISGTPERPRLCVRRSLKNLYVQVIDDMKSITLAAASTRDKNFTGTDAKRKKSEAASQLGKYFAGQLKEKGILKIAFDRAGYQYHGRIKALAEAMREAGIQF